MQNTIARRTKSAFTLIELLVVIAIIAILAAILFPVFGRARENARRSTCQSNLKQMGLGVMQYTQDYDEKLPFAGLDSNGQFPWHYTIQPYVKSTQLFKCPSNTRTNDVAYTNYLGVPAIPISYMCNGGGSYSDPAEFGTNANGTAGKRPMNRAPDTAGGGFPVKGGAALAEFVSSAQTILVLENSGTGNNSDLYNASDITPTNTPLQSHLGMTNFLYADGHIKSMKPLNTISGGVNQWLIDPVGATAATTLKTNLGAQQNLMQ